MEGFRIRKPFFEIGPKTYIYGKKALELAVAADRASRKYQVDIIFSAQYTDIRPIAEATSRIKVFAQHMDQVYPGKGIGAVLPEALKEAGAVGVLLNHAERPLTLDEIRRSVERAGEVGLAALVCAGTPQEAAAAASLGPDMILAEAPGLIGKGARGPGDMEEIARINQAVHRVAPGMMILHGAGISDEKDVYEVIKAGADATGSTSGIMKADNPCEMMEKMIASVAAAWIARHQTRPCQD